MTRKALSDVEPFTLSFERPVIRPEAIVLAPDPVESLLRLRGSVRAAIEKALGPGTVDLGPTSFQPHVSFAYVRTGQSTAAVLKAIDSIEATPAQLLIDTVPLIEMHRDNRMYEWRTLHTMRLRAD